MGKLFYGSQGGTVGDPPEIIAADAMTLTWQYASMIPFNEHTRAIFMVGYTTGADEASNAGGCDITLQVASKAGSEAAFYMIPSRNPLVYGPEIFHIKAGVSAEVQRVYYRYTMPSNEEWKYIRLGYRSVGGGLGAYGIFGLKAMVY